MTSILVIDDSPEELELLTDLLQTNRPDVEVTLSTEGAKGVVYAATKPFDCVLLDLRLDGKDGLEVLVELRRTAPSLPVIVLTGQGSEQTATDAFLAGAAYYLAKRDLTAEALWAALQRAMHQVATTRELKSKREALERSNRLDAVGQLAAGIAHDFNNQLGILLYCLQALKPSLTTDIEQNHVAISFKSIEQSRLLANRLLALSQHSEMMTQHVQIGSVFNDLRALTLASISSEITLDFAPLDTDVAVFCDPNQLLNVLINLVLNGEDAIKRSEQQGTITVSATSTADTVRLAISDTGCGMSATVLEKCRDPFFTTKQDRNGTGLGLAMAQSFARENAGELAFSSALGRGTTVTVVLPKHP